MDAQTYNLYNSLNLCIMLYITFKFNVEFLDSAPILNASSLGLILL